MSEAFIRVVADQKLEVEAKKSESWCSRMEECLLDPDSPLAQVVMGVRRSGKSTLCHKVLRDKGIHYAYLNFDDERLIRLQADQLDALLESLYRVYGDFRHLFLDEVQNIDGWHLFVNRLLRQGLHVIVTGSNAKLLGSDLATHLTGRHVSIELYPFSFSEFVSYQGLNCAALDTKNSALVKRAYDAYQEQGGLPELFHVAVAQQKAYVQTLLQSILYKDILQRFNVKYPKALGDVATLVMENFAREVSCKTIAETLGLGSVHTVQNYLAYLGQAYLVIPLTKFSYKPSIRLRSQKSYLVDTAFIQHGTSELSGENLGWRLENVVYLELLRRRVGAFHDIHFFKEGYEVDFVLVKDRKVFELIQVCYDIGKPKTRKRELTGLVRGSLKLQCDKLTLITQSHREQIVFEGLSIQAIPIVDWLLAGS